MSKSDFYFKEKGYSTSLRIRLWDENIITSLLSKYNQLAYKYFSLEAKDRSDYRKTYEDLYKENVEITNQFEKLNTELQKEKRNKFILERKAAWEILSFTAAHKLGNPIDSIDTFHNRLNKFLALKDYKKASEISKNMDQAIEDAKRLIAEFKSLAKAEEIKIQPNDIVELIENSLKIVTEKGIEYHINKPDKLPKVLCDYDKISDCFSELVHNSIHFMTKSQKEININIQVATITEVPKDLDKSRKYLKIVYSDTGCGVSNDRKEKIFIPFNSSEVHGTGLGLPMVKKVIEGHEGKITEVGVLNSGASFEIFLPIFEESKK
jgi:signal transduction histidine kinase